MAKKEDSLNACGHRNSERIEALKKLPSSVCPACLLERIEKLEAENGRLESQIETLQIKFNSASMELHPERRSY